MPQGDVTRLLVAAGSGDRVAFDALYRAVYDELRGLAASSMRRESAGHTLQPTALVNEAYLRLAGSAGNFAGRRHFFGAASQAMRRILVDHARARDAEKRGADYERVTLSAAERESEPQHEFDVLALDAAIAALEAEAPRLAELISLRFFAGLSIEDAARALGISPATAKRDWVFARAYLYERLSAAADT
jgi:RNA polymerase sigma-70 factor (ECF subfamily)